MTFNLLLPRWVFFYLAAFLMECGMMAIWLAEPIFANDRLAASPLALGWMGTLNAGGYALLAVAGGWVSDRTGRRRWMLLGAGSQILLILLLPHCRSVTAFIALTATHSTLLAFFWPPFMSLFSETMAPAGLSRALSFYNISWCLGGIVGSAISGPLYDRLGPAAPFIFGAAAISGVVAIHALGQPGPPVYAPEHHAAGRRALVLRRQAWLTVIANFFVVSLLIYLFPRLAQSPRLALGASAITVLHALRMGAMVATFALMGATVGWHFRQWPVHLCFGLMLAMMVLTALAPAGRFFILPFAVFGVTTGIAYGLSAYYSMLAPAGKGAVVGIHEMFLASGGTLGPIFGGVVIAATGRPEAPFWIGLAPLAVVWFASAWMTRRLRH